MVGSPPDKAVGVASSPTSATFFATSAVRASPPQASAEASADVSASPLDAPVHQQSPKSTNTVGSRKRVFTFQKRWLHSLPIIERSLPDSDTENQVHNDARMTTGDPAASAAASDSDKLKDVIVCMLCDEPASKRELTKVWSRLNCRRGRIENHLMSKHPEFMRLLKHKREAEGDLAVQIFLQNLRDGRCNARTEINNGLYGQLAIACGAGAGDGAAAADTAGRSSSAAVEHMELQKRALGDYMGNVREELDLNRKRLKLTALSAHGMDAAAMALSPYSAGSIAMSRTNGAASADAAGVDGLASSVLYQDGMMSAQWQTVVYNKLVRTDKCVLRLEGGSVVTHLFERAFIPGGGNGRRPQRHNVRSDLLMAHGGKCTAYFCVSFFFEGCA